MIPFLKDCFVSFSLFMSKKISQSKTHFLKVFLFFVFTRVLLPR